MIGGIGIVDLALASVLALSVLIGLFRGLVFELMSLAGWVVAYFAAVWFAPELARHVPIGAPGSALNHSAALAACFILALVAWGLSLGCDAGCIWGSAPTIDATGRLLGWQAANIRGR